MLECPTCWEQTLKVTCKQNGNVYCQCKSCRREFKKVRNGGDFGIYKPLNKKKNNKEKANV